MVQFAIVSSWILSHWLSYLINNGNEYSDNGMITSCDSLAPYKSKYKFIIGNHESSFLVAWSIESESTGTGQSIWRLDPIPFILSWDIELGWLIIFAAEFISSTTSVIELITMEVILQLSGQSRPITSRKSTKFHSAASLLSNSRSYFESLREAASNHVCERFTFFNFESINRYCQISCRSSRKTRARETLSQVSLIRSARE